MSSSAKRVIVRAGRRGGKTVGVAIRSVKRFLKGRRQLYAAPTAEQIQRYWVTVCRMLQPAIDAGLLHKNETYHTIEVPGTEQRIRAKTAWNADSLRGDYADDLYLDEWQLMNEEAWGLVGAPMLLDNDGDAVFIYTPPSLNSRSVSKADDPQHAAKLFKKFKKEMDEGNQRYAAFHFTSHDNPHLSTSALDEISGDMTALAYRMEIEAEDVDEAPGALWTRHLIEDTRRTEKREYDRIVVAIDPSASSTGDEAGIITAGRIGDNADVLADNSVQGSPKTWASAAVRAYHEYDADRIVAEANNGGEMVKLTINTVDPNVPVRLVHASRGKQTRAEPVASLFEHGRAHLVGTFTKLEDEMCLAAGTLITTRRGNIPIEKVVVGDEALTRQGYKHVGWSGTTGVARKIVHIKTEKSRHLQATVSHPIYNAEYGFIPAATLKIGDGLETNEWLINREKRISMGSRSSGVGGAGLSITEATTWTGRASYFIGRFGNRHTGKYQRAILFTTRMKTVLTLIWEILKRSALRNTQQFILATGGLNLNVQGSLNTEKPFGIIQNREQFSALDAGSHLPVLGYEPCFAGRNADADTIQSIDITDCEIPVYNLTIDDAHEYYANGILVHNCLWTPGDDSPNRMDAMVWALTELLIGQRKILAA